MLLGSLIEEFLEYAREQQGLARSSLDTWRCHLRAWGRYEGALSDVSGITKERLESYVVYLARERKAHVWKGELIKGRHKEQGLRPRTIRSVFSAIRAFLEWACKKKKLLPDNPARGIVLPKLDAAVRPLAEDSDVEDAFAMCARLPSLRRAALARAVLSVLVMGGLRRNEMLALKLSDVKKDRIIIREGKGKKGRSVYPHPDCLQAIEDYKTVRPYNASEWLFVLDYHRRFARGALAALIRELASLAGLSEPAALLPHTLRHWNSTNMLRNGATLEDVKEHLGHSSIATTAVYVHSGELRRSQIAHTTGLPGQSKPPKAPQPKPDAGRRPPDNRRRASWRRQP